MRGDYLVESEIANFQEIGAPILLPLAPEAKRLLKVLLEALRDD